MSGETSEYADYEQRSAPPWLSGFFGQAWSYVSGLAKDAWVEAAKQAVKARFVGLAPIDALGHLLWQYALPDRFDETETQTRARLRAAWPSWQASGRKAGLITALAAAGYPNVVIHERAGRWWEFVVVLRPPYPFDPATIGWATWDAGWTWGGGYRFFGVAPARERERVLAIIRHWAPAYARLLYVVVGVQGPYYGEFTYGDGTVYGGRADYWS